MLKDQKKSAPHTNILHPQCLGQTHSVYIKKYGSDQRNPTWQKKNESQYGSGLWLPLALQDIMFNGNGNK